MKVCFRKLISALLSALLLAQLGCAALADAPETVDEGAHWAAAAMDRAVADGYLTGFEDGTLRPNAALTAAQLLSILVRARELPPPSDQTVAAAPMEVWYYRAACQAVEAGLIDREFTAFEKPVARGDALLIAARAYGLGGAADTSAMDGFADAGTLRGADLMQMAGLIERGLVRGWEGSLHLDGELTRAEFVTLLYRLEEFDEAVWLEENPGAQLPGPGELPPPVTPEEEERVLGLVSSGYAGDYTTEWAEEHDYTAAEKEIWVNAQGYESPTGLLIWVNLTYQRANIFDLRDGRWTLLRSCLVGTGAPGTDTPRGVWRVTYHNAAGWTTASYSVSPVVGFKGGGYAFHSRLCWPGTREVSDPGIGYPISHGCIRMYHEDIDWVFENIPVDTTVVVY